MSCSLIETKEKIVFTGFDTPPDAVILQIRGTMTSDCHRDSDSEWKVRIADFRPFVVYRF